MSVPRKWEPHDEDPGAWLIEIGTDDDDQEKVLTLCQSVERDVCGDLQHSWSLVLDAEWDFKAASPKQARATAVAAAKEVVTRLLQKLNEIEASS